MVHLSLVEKLFPGTVSLTKLHNVLYAHFTEVVVNTVDLFLHRIAVRVEAPRNSAKGRRQGTAPRQGASRPVVQLKSKATNPEHRGAGGVRRGGRLAVSNFADVIKQ